MAEAVGIDNEQILGVLKEMGFDRETVRLLFLVPILQVAWSDGSLSPQERALIVEAARSHGIVEGHPARARLEGWLASRPSPQTFERALVVIRDLMSFQTAGGRDEVGRKLVDSSGRVACGSSARSDLAEEQPRCSGRRRSRPPTPIGAPVLGDIKG
jgi:hypothetical protein